MKQQPYTRPSTPEQNQEEFYWMMAKIGKAESILEIGSREGSSLRAMAPFLAPGAIVCSIDSCQTNPEWKNGADTKDGLRETIRSLREQGFDAHLLIADSKDKASLEWAKSHGPFDFIFIDADHEYAGVSKDWRRYGQLGDIIAFHDIGGYGVKTLWEEIKEEGLLTEEMYAPDGMGVGIVRRVD